jgi:hypothetical protein
MHGWGVKLLMDVFIKKFKIFFFINLYFIGIIDNKRIMVREVWVER